ncbi:hypothetical protein QSJ19_20500 [Gordonia sp. ABSL11-1]|uniref:hypothetical protein n=1 Tax=Gordonia sp. ABSL11-1 TaxID=3053924 RepID=UPI0025738DE6|nr:hypothetical protein [Gordonia sp. ABSL11-1]MDL9947917.1 hypothetical protein [Gordonia sp. ABSL11-1]
MTDPQQLPPTPNPGADRFADEPIVIHPSDFGDLTAPRYPIGPYPSGGQQYPDQPYPHQHHPQQYPLHHYPPHHVGHGHLAQPPYPPRGRTPRPADTRVRDDERAHAGRRADEFVPAWPTSRPDAADLRPVVAHLDHRRRPARPTVPDEA